MDMQKDTIITEITSVKLNEEGKKTEELYDYDNSLNNDDYIEKYDGGYNCQFSRSNSILRSRLFLFS